VDLYWSSYCRLLSFRCLFRDFVLVRVVITKPKGLRVELFDTSLPYYPTLQPTHSPSGDRVFRFITKSTLSPSDSVDNQEKHMTPYI
jgi:hypothetical protein